MTVPATVQAQARPPGPSARLSVAVLVLGLVAGGFGLYAALAPLFRELISSTSFATPGQRSMHLSTGRYFVYERTGSSGFGLQQGGTTTLTPAQVSVTSGGGETVFVGPTSGSREVITRSGSQYTSALAFNIDTAGSYMVTVKASAPGRVVVARPLSDAIRSRLRWWALVAAGGIAVVTGTVMWIIGASRRRRRRLSYAYYASATPAGWYPDPQQPGRMRYWNGTMWTEHTN
jgi:hypothetical protein